MTTPNRPFLGVAIFCATLTACTASGSGPSATGSDAGVADAPIAPAKDAGSMPGSDVPVFVDVPVMVDLDAPAVDVPGSLDLVVNRPVGQAIGIDDCTDLAQLGVTLRDELPVNFPTHALSA